MANAPECSDACKPQTGKLFVGICQIYSCQRRYERPVVANLATVAVGNRVAPILAKATCREFGARRGLASFVLIDAQ